MSEKMTLVPNKTKPILTKTSVESADRNQSGSLKKLPIAKPIAKLKIRKPAAVKFFKAPTSSAARGAGSRHRGSAGSPSSR